MWKKIFGITLPIVVSLYGESASASYIDHAKSPYWSNDDVTVTAFMYCSINKNALGWPFPKCNNPVLTVKKKESYTSDKAFVAYGDLLISDGQNQRRMLSLSTRR